MDVHGEANLVCTFEPATVLDAGCGTGRVAIELARRGIAAVGVDRDESMLATARRRAPGLRFVTADLTAFDLHESFDVVVLAGNVPLFTEPGTQAALVTCCAHHVRPGGVMITGFQLGRGYELDRFDADAAAAGLRLTERYATWEADPFVDGGDYAVSVHQRSH